MAAISSQSLQCSNPVTLFFSSSASASASASSSSSPRIFSSLKLHAPPHSKSNILRAANSDDNDVDTESDQTQRESSSSDAGSFESRLAQIRLRNRSGLGKKAEQRKTRKGKKGSTTSGPGLYLPPVALVEPVSEGLKVEFGFTPYSERVNGRIALIGLTALILVELSTGQAVIKYHSPAVVLIQVYFMAAASAVFLKYEKEKLSVWPQSSPDVK